MGEDRRGGVSDDRRATGSVSRYSADDCRHDSRPALHAANRRHDTPSDERVNAEINGQGYSGEHRHDELYLQGVEYEEGGGTWTAMTGAAAGRDRVGTNIGTSGGEEDRHDNHTLWDNCVLREDQVVAEEMQMGNSPDVEYQHTRDHATDVAEGKNERGGHARSTQDILSLFGGFGETPPKETSDTPQKYSSGQDGERESTCEPVESGRAFKTSEPDALCRHDPSQHEESPGPGTLLSGGRRTAAEMRRAQRMARESRNRAAQAPNSELVAASAPPSTAADTAAEWACEVCGVHGSPSASSCRVCGASRRALDGIQHTGEAGQGLEELGSGDGGGGEWGGHDHGGSVDNQGKCVQAREEDGRDRNVDERGQSAHSRVGWGHQDFGQQIGDVRDEDGTADAVYHPKPGDPLLVKTGNVAVTDVKGRGVRSCSPTNGVLSQVGEKERSDVGKANVTVDSASPRVAPLRAPLGIRMQIDVGSSSDSDE